MSKEFVIPSLSKEEIARRYQHIKPIINHTHYLRGLSTSELTGTAYTWLKGKSDLREKVDFSKLSFLQDCKMLHTYGAPVFFKPSVGEVLRQIPEDLLSKVVAFEMLDEAVSYNDVFYDELNAGYHVSIVRLYQAKDDTNETAKPVINYPSDDSKVPVGMTQEQFERIYKS